MYIRPTKSVHPTYKKVHPTYNSVHLTYKKATSDLQKVYIRPTNSTSHLQNVYIWPTKSVYIRPTKSVHPTYKKCTPDLKKSVHPTYKKCTFWGIFQEFPRNQLQEMILEKFLKESHHSWGIRGNSSLLLLGDLQKVYIRPTKKCTSDLKQLKCITYLTLKRVYRCLLNQLAPCSTNTKNSITPV